MDHNKLWKILQGMGLLDHFICLLRNLYAGQEHGHGAADWFQSGKGVRQGNILLTLLIYSMQSTSLEMLGWMKDKQESRLIGEKSITLDMQMTQPL